MPRIIARKPGQFRMTVSRSTSNRGPDMVNITLEDDVSGIEFFDGEMSVEEYGYLLTGLSSRPLAGEVRGLQYIGKKCVRERRSAELPEALEKMPYSGQREAIEDWLLTEKAEEGWLVDPYIGSQGSFSTKDGKRFVNYGVYKYVDPEVLNSEKKES